MAVMSQRSKQLKSQLPEIPAQWIHKRVETATQADFISCGVYALLVRQKIIILRFLLHASKNIDRRPGITFLQIFFSWINRNSACFTRIAKRFHLDVLH